jgi:hypothetical protein
MLPLIQFKIWDHISLCVGLSETWLVGCVHILSNNKKNRENKIIFPLIRITLEYIFSSFNVLLFNHRLCPSIQLIIRSYRFKAYSNRSIDFNLLYYNISWYNYFEWHNVEIAGKITTYCYKMYSVSIYVIAKNLNI